MTSLSGNRLPLASRVAIPYSANSLLLPTIAVDTFFRAISSVSLPTPVSLAWNARRDMSSAVPPVKRCSLRTSAAALSNALTESTPNATAPAVIAVNPPAMPIASFDILLPDSSALWSTSPSALFAPEASPRIRTSNLRSFATSSPLVLCLDHLVPVLDEHSDFFDRHPVTHLRRQPAVEVAERRHRL